MSSIKKFSLLLICYIAMHLLFLPSATALGISPGKLIFKEVMSDGFASTQVLVSSASPEEEIVALTVEDDFASWLSFVPNQTTIKVKREHPQLTTIQVHPPSDIPEGVYKTTIRLTKLNLNPADQQFGSFVVSEIIAPIEIEVTNQRKIVCSAGGLKIYETEAFSSMLMDFQLVNQGNVRVKPTIKINVFDSSGRLVFQHDEQSKYEVLPTTKEKVEIYFPHTLPEGNFLAAISMSECDFKESVPFNVLPKGSLKEQGTIIKLEHKPFAYATEQVPVTAAFQNEGELPVYAQLKVEIKKGGKLIDVLESEKILVKGKDQERLSVYWSPTDPGQYYFGAKVSYGSVSEKQTVTSPSVITIVTKEDVGSKHWINPIPYLILVVMFIVIMFLLKKIKKRSTI